MRRSGNPGSSHHVKPALHVSLTPFFASFAENEVNSTDTLNFDSSGALAGNTGAKSSQSYNSFNTRGRRYSCLLASENNVLTSFSQGCTDK
jgi:hypothetical protein